MRKIKFFLTLATILYVSSSIFSSLYSQNIDEQKGSKVLPELQESDLPRTSISKKELEDLDFLLNETHLLLDSESEISDSLLPLKTPFIDDGIDDFDFSEKSDSLLSENEFEIIDLEDFEEIDRLQTLSITPINNKVDIDFGGEVSLQNLFFQESPIYPFQESYYSMISSSPKLDLKFGEDKNQKIVAHLNANLGSSDTNRTYIDFPKLYYQLTEGIHKFLVGSNVEYWGVSELSNSLNSINQQDFLKDPIGRERLGQPMFKYTGNYKVGSLDLFYLPYHRSRRFTGLEGRFRPIIPINNDPIYETSAAEWEPSLAARFSKSTRALDFAVSYFNGVDTNPIFFIDLVNATIQQQYLKTQNISLEALVSVDRYSFKFDGLYKDRSDDSFFLVTPGVEASFSNVFQTGVNALLIGEYIYNGQENAQNQGILLENDFLMGVRLDFNDASNTSLSLGGGFDLDDSGKFFLIQGDTRIFETWKLGFTSAFLAELAPFDFDDQVILDFIEEQQDLIDMLPDLTVPILPIDTSNLQDLLLPLRREGYFTITLTKYF